MGTANAFNNVVRLIRAEPPRQAKKEGIHKHANDGNEKDRQEYGEHGFVASHHFPVLLWELFDLF
jgi:hypothetical protein